MSENEKVYQTTIFDYLEGGKEVKEEWKKELLTKYFMATFNLTSEEAKTLIKDNFNEITLDEEKVKNLIFFDEVKNG